jgi:hypothetical protein
LILTYLLAKKRKGKEKQTQKDKEGRSSFFVLEFGGESVRLARRVRKPSSPELDLDR